MASSAPTLSAEALCLIIADHARGEHRDKSESICPSCTDGTEPESDELVSLSVSPELA